MLHVYGTADLTGVTLSNLQRVVLHSDVTFTDTQIAALNAAGAAIAGDGAHGPAHPVIAIAASLKLLAMTNTARQSMTHRVIAIAASPALLAMTNTARQSMTPRVIASAARQSMTPTLVRRHGSPRPAASR